MINSQCALVKSAIVLLCVHFAHACVVLWFMSTESFKQMLSSRRTYRSTIDHALKMTRFTPASLPDVLKVTPPGDQFVNILQDYIHTNHR